LIALPPDSPGEGSTDELVRSRRAVMAWWTVCLAAWIVLFSARTPWLATSAYLLANLSLVGLTLYALVRPHEKR
jgi:hypothetical protein